MLRQCEQALSNNFKLFTTVFCASKAAKYLWGTLIIKSTAIEVYGDGDGDGYGAPSNTAPKMNLKLKNWLSMVS